MLGGGEMVATVGRNHVEYAPAPHKFEAGTPPILETIVLAAALDYLESVGRSIIAAREATIGRPARARCAAIPGLHVFGATEHHDPILTIASATYQAPELPPLMAGTGSDARARPH